MEDTLRRAAYVLCAFCIVNLSFASGYKFQSFKLGPKLQVKNNKTASALNKFHSSSIKEHTPIEFSAPDEDDNENGMFEQIASFLRPNYQQVGDSLATSIMQKNKQFNLGKRNYSGFVWQKPMGNFVIGVDRQLAPDLFDDTRWIVTDKFILNIDAHTYLHNLNEDGTIEISKKQLAAFAGIVFRREYRYVHFAGSFEDGLKKDFNKLFFSFTNFRGGNFTKLRPYEYLVKEDYLTTSVGAYGNIPITSFGRLRAGAMALKTRIASASILALGPSDIKEVGEKLRLSFEKEEVKTRSSELSLKFEFFNLLKLTLLSYERESEYSRASKLYFSFYEDDLDNLIVGTPVFSAVCEVLKLRPSNTEILAPYIVSTERRMSEKSNTYYGILLFGGAKKYNTEQVTFQKNGIIETFFTNRSEEIKYVRGLFGTILNALVARFLPFSFFSKYKSTRARKLTMEFQESTTPHATKDIYIESEADLSIKISHNFSTKKTKGFFNRKYRRYAVHFAKNFTNLPSDVIKHIKRKKIIGPLSMEVTARIDEPGITHFNNISISHMFDILASVCRYKKSGFGWFSSYSSKSTRCYKKLTKKFVSYLSELNQTQEIPLWKLKDFLRYFNKYSDHRHDLTRIFGAENVYFNGSLKAMTKQKVPFLTYFNEGTFTGLGIIAKYQQDALMRTPASL